jgi:hypothetical protein
MNDQSNSKHRIFPQILVSISLDEALDIFKSNETKALTIRFGGLSLRGGRGGGGIGRGREARREGGRGRGRESARAHDEPRAI